MHHSSQSSGPPSYGSANTGLSTLKPTWISNRELATSSNGLDVTPEKLKAKSPEEKDALILRLQVCDTVHMKMTCCQVRATWYCVQLPEDRGSCVLRVRMCACICGVICQFLSVSFSLIRSGPAPPSSPFHCLPLLFQHDLLYVHEVCSCIP